VAEIQEHLSAAVSLTEDDIAALSDYYYKNTRSGRRRDRIMKTAPVLAAALWAITASTHPEWGIKDPAKFALYLSTGIPIIVGLGWFCLWYLRPTVARWSVQYGVRKRMLEPVTITLEPEGIRLDNAHGTGRAPWAGVTQVGQTEDYLFLLFVGPNGFVVPRRVFGDAAAFEQYCEAAMLFHEERI
jgi:hypothetical protein